MSVSIVCIERASKAMMEELHIPGVGRPNPAETRTGDTAILSVVEAYCNNAHFKPPMRKLTAAIYMCVRVYMYVHVCE